MSFFSGTLLSETASSPGQATAQRENLVETCTDVSWTCGCGETVMET